MTDGGQLANQRNKAAARAWWRWLDGAPFAGAPGVRLASDFAWRGPAPFEMPRGFDAFVSGFVQPFRAVFPGISRETHLFFGGASDGKRDGSADGRMWVCGGGYLTGRQAEPFLGIPASARKRRIRWADFLRFEGEELAESHFMVDFVDWFEQAGRPVLPVSRGAAGVWPAATAFDGVLEEPADEAETAHTQALIREFLFAGLNRFDRSDLKSMGVARFFHPNVKWYGPGGIGACLSLREFEDLHQKPWLIAYPDRQVQDLDSLFSEGRLCGSSAWAGVRATHTGPYLDCPATGREIVFNGIDFWLRTDDVFTENWVFVDMVHLFSQFGIDLFARMRESDGSRPAAIPVMEDDPR